MSKQASEIKQKLYGINDDHDTCSNCGKTNLKRVMWIGLEDDSVDPAPYGTTCGARLLSVSTHGGSKKVWSNMASKAIEEIWEGFQTWMKEESFIREIADIRAMNGYRKVQVPKTMVFKEWKDVMTGDIGQDEFFAARNEQYPIFQISRMDAGSLVGDAVYRGDWSGINNKLAIVRNAPKGLRPIK